MKNRFENSYLPYILAYTGFFVAAYSLLCLLGVVDTLPGNNTFLKWDATFYADIKNNGYLFTPDKPCNAGFLPLFAVLWYVSGLGALGMGILNGIIYLLSLNWLCKILQPDKLLLGIFMSLPFIFFLFTPLAESLYFLFGTCLLYGIRSKKNGYIFSAILLASLTRASFLFILPACLGMYLLSSPWSVWRTLHIWKSIALYYVLPLFLGFLIIACVQYVQTGEPFAYYKTQSHIWGRVFGIPVLPFGRYTEPWIFRLSIISYWLGALIVLIGIKFGIDRLFRNTILPENKQYVYFSILYLVMSFLSILFFNPEWNWIAKKDYSSTYLTGVNRYLQPTPFTFVLLIWVFQQGFRSKWWIAGLFIGTHILWLTIDPPIFAHIQYYLIYLPITGILCVYWLYYYLKWRPIGYILIAGSSVLQCLMFNYFMLNIQVD